MKSIEKFLTEMYTQEIVIYENTTKCIFTHKENLTGIGLVYFELAKNSWSKKPIISERQYVIVDAKMGDVLQFLNQYYNLCEDDYHQVRTAIINLAIDKMDSFYS